MSRAFVKEPDGDTPGDGTLERPRSTHPNYITPEGLERLRARAEDLRKQKAVSDKEKAAALERELRLLDDRIASAIVVTPESQTPDSIAFGTTFETEDENGVRRTFRIVGEDEADSARGYLSWLSPLAKDAMGAKVGDEIIWQRPSGDLDLTVKRIRACSM